MEGKVVRLKREEMDMKIDVLEIMEIIESWVDIDEVYDDLHSSLSQYLIKALTGKEE